jgi:chemotaxis protein methyltransferase CheR
MTTHSLLSASDLRRLAEIVHEETGNRIQEKNHSMLESRMRTHLLNLGLSRMSEYWSHFSAHELSEREVIRGLMTTHYTFFFREYAHFEALEKWLLAEAPRLNERFRKSGQPLRVWSAACSRGQEVYSLAMFLDDVLGGSRGIPFEVLGTDIDPQSIEYAKNGVYPLKEVSTIPTPFLQKHWKKGTGAIKAFAAARPELKTRVRFEERNLVDSASWPSEAPHDIIFCRNVFIYFAENTVRDIALALNGRLAEPGLFVSGLSEPMRFADWPHPALSPSVYQKLPSRRDSSSASTPLSDSGATTTTGLADSAQASTPASGFRLLVVDDSPTIQALMKKIFARDPRCREVVTANHGKEARQRLDESTFDLITLDIHMPVMGGLEFLESQYDARKDPPVLMVSSVSREDVDLATRSLKLGAFDYVEKPAMNRIQQSSQELLAKAALALRARRGDRAPAPLETAYDRDLSHKVVVPDASQCLRLVLADERRANELLQIIRGQEAESRSPPLVICGSQGEELASELETRILEASPLPILKVSRQSSLLRPGHIYTLGGGSWSLLAPYFQGKAVSLQVLNTQLPADLWQSLHKARELQILVDEFLGGTLPSQIERDSGRRVSDRTPCTSFASLSLEFFAGLRKAAA